MDEEIEAPKVKQFFDGTLAYSYCDCNYYLSISDNYRVKNKPGMKERDREERQNRGKEGRKMGRRRRKGRRRKRKLILQEKQPIPRTMQSV